MNIMYVQTGITVDSRMKWAVCMHDKCIQNIRQKKQKGEVQMENVDVNVRA
jgi:hypothetical protein